ncbi:MAG: nuclear transport factor 2 family protein [Pseudomonadota bacterium]
MGDAATDNERIAQLEARVAQLEAAEEIRAVIARYFEICDRLDASAPMEELGQLFSDGAVWQGKGAKYQKDFGGHRGRDEIVAFLDRHRSPSPHFAHNVHFLTTETLTVDGETAKGTWVMLQTPTFHTGEAFALSARIAASFTKENGAWRISNFGTTNLFSRRIEGRWDQGDAIPKPQN